MGHTTRYGYDALNRKISTTDATSETTSMTYDAVGNLLSLTDPTQNTTTYIYDALACIIHEVYKEWQVLPKQEK